MRVFIFHFSPLKITIIFQNFVNHPNSWKLVVNINPCCNKKCEKKCIQGNGCIRVKLDGKLEYNKRVDDKGRSEFKKEKFQERFKN